MNVSWQDLGRILTKESWRTALENQKGVYLITDLSNGKKYVGSAYGNQVLLGRWSAYAASGHGGSYSFRTLAPMVGVGFTYLIAGPLATKLVAAMRERWS